MSSPVDLSLQSFVPLLSQTFTARVGEQALPLSLIEVTSLGAAPTPAMREPFSLVFQGPLSPLLEQRTYVLEHAELGAPAIFLVPIGRGRDGVTYQAIFT